MVYGCSKAPVKLQQSNQRPQKSRRDNVSYVPTEVEAAYSGLLDTLLALPGMIALPIPTAASPSFSLTGFVERWRFSRKKPHRRHPTPFRRSGQTATSEMKRGRKLRRPLRLLLVRLGPERRATADLSGPSGQLHPVSAVSPCTAEHVGGRVAPRALFFHGAAGRRRFTFLIHGARRARSL
jgi:hypothetical protein